MLLEYIERAFRDGWQDGKFRAIRKTARSLGMEIIGPGYRPYDAEILLIVNRWAYDEAMEERTEAG
jgi:hypothetical protein